MEKIKLEGPMPFRDFMDMCLYYPGHGFYVSEGQKIGKGGDFYTSCNLTPSFGATIAKQIEEIWQLLGRGVFTVVEYGAGMGILSRDILDELRQNKVLYEGLRYCIIEKSPYMQGKEKECLQQKVYWYQCLEDIDNDIHCVFSNELVDNLPVHQVVMQDELMEVYLDYQDGFKELLKPADIKLKQYFETMGVELPGGYRTEVNLDAIDWIQSVGSRIVKGFIITIDYGDISTELYKPHRSCGTLVSYNKHQATGDIYCNVGQQDITAHVNFSALQHWGKEAGISTCGMTPQAFFLLSLGFRERLERSVQEQNKNIFQAAKEINLINHTLLYDMGHKYKVLIQSKGMPGTTLSGLRLSHCQTR